MNKRKRIIMIIIIYQILLKKTKLMCNSNVIYLSIS